MEPRRRFTKTRFRSHFSTDFYKTGVYGKLTTRHTRLYNYLNCKLFSNVFIRLFLLVWIWYGLLGILSVILIGKNVSISKKVVCTFWCFNVCTYPYAVRLMLRERKNELVIDTYVLNFYNTWTNCHIYERVITYILYCLFCII